eukprot:1141934-Pelagomonas_calceolata.AAC.3
MSRPFLACLHDGTSSMLWASQGAGKQACAWGTQRALQGAHRWACKWHRKKHTQFDMQLGIEWAPQEARARGCALDDAKGAQEV